MLTTAILCLAANMFFEARNEEHLGRLMVAEVTLNRVESSRHPDTVCEVVFANRQFSWTQDRYSNNPETYTTYYDSLAWEELSELATHILSGEEPLPDNGALFFHTNYIDSPTWVASMEVVGSVGSHIFYTYKE